MNIIDKQNIIRHLKNIEVGDLNSCDIPIKKDNGLLIGYLRPIGNMLIHDELVINSLTRWRQKFMKYFLTQFEATNQRTSSWLQNIVLEDDTRILFLIVDNTGKAIGNFGVSNITESSAELDNLIRGEKGGDSQLIFFSEISLMLWLYNTLEIKDIYLHVLSNNAKTIALHHSVGFEKYQTKYLTKRSKNDEIFYVISDNIAIDSQNLALIKMKMNREYFVKTYTN